MTRFRSLALGGLLVAVLGLLGVVAHAQGYGLRPLQDHGTCELCKAGSATGASAPLGSSAWGLKASKPLPQPEHASLDATDSRSRTRDRDSGR